MTIVRLQPAQGVVLTFYQLVVVALKCSPLLGHHGVGVVSHLDNALDFAGQEGV